MEVEKVLMQNYMPYAKGVILQRAVPQLDGMKPVNLRILYAMYKTGLLTKRRKAAGIVGEVMKYHPNGDASIYNAMVRMVDANESLLAPMIRGKGNYGKSFSRDLECAAMRYPEASLLPIAEEFFDGIYDGAVDMVDNFDSTEKEPSILPVKFPNVLVNASSGIAVGLASKIPSFNLKAVCEATIKLLHGEISDSDELMDILGAPDFPTGGFIHVEENELYRLGRYGNGGFYVSGAVSLYRNAIMINQIPFGTTIESIIESIEDNKKTELKEVESVTNLTSLKGLQIEVRLKPGSDPRKVLEKLKRLTNITMKVSYNTAVIIDGAYKQLGILALLEEWVRFRENCISRTYSKRAKDLAVEEHRLSAFELIYPRLDRASEIMQLDEQAAKQGLIAEFGMDETQAEYLGDCKRKEFYADRIVKRIERLLKIRETLGYYNRLVNESDARHELICAELREISDKYGEPRRTKMVGPLELVVETDESEPDNSPAVIIVTEHGYVTKLNNTKTLSTFEEDPEDKVRWRIKTTNSGTVLLFTYSGLCYKLRVKDVPSPSRGHSKEYLFNVIKREDDSELCYAQEAGDYSGWFNVVYRNGSGTRVTFDRVSGNRKVYHSLFEGGDRTSVFITPYDEFFMITKARKAAFVNLKLGREWGRKAFKVARIDKGDSIFGLQPMENVPEKESWDIERLARYMRGYTVKIKDDKLW